MLGYEKLCNDYANQFSPTLRVECKIAIDKLNRYHGLSFKDIYALLKSKTTEEWEQYGHFHLLFKEGYRKVYLSISKIDWTDWFLKESTKEEYATVIKEKYYDNIANKKQFANSVRQLVNKGKAWEWILMGLTDRTVEHWNKYGLGLLFTDNYSKRIDQIYKRSRS